MAPGLAARVVGHQGGGVSRHVGTEGVAGQAQASRSFSRGCSTSTPAPGLLQDEPADATAVL
jgi:hypothetical protein